MNSRQTDEKQWLPSLNPSVAKLLESNMLVYSFAIGLGLPLPLGRWNILLGRHRDEVHGFFFPSKVLLASAFFSVFLCAETLTA